MASAKVAVNGTSSGASAEIQDQITLALLANGGVGRIQTALQERLDETGWTEHVRDYVTKLFRTGECTTFFEALERVKSQVSIEGVDSGNSKRRGQANGSTEDLVIPKTAAEGGVDAVKKELMQICEVKK